MYVAIAKLMNGTVSMCEYPVIFDMSFEQAVKHMKADFKNDTYIGWEISIIEDSNEKFYYCAIDTLNKSFNLPTYVSIKNQEVNIIVNNV